MFPEAVFEDRYQTHNRFGTSNAFNETLTALQETQYVTFLPEVDETTTEAPDVNEVSIVMNYALY